MDEALRARSLPFRSGPEVDRGLCGIAGVFGTRCPHDGRDRIEAALAHLTYRGPDSVGVAHLPTGWLGATRLRMVGSPNERVPVESAGGSLVLAFNGEVYVGTDLQAWQQSTTCSDGHRLAAQIDLVGIRAALTGLDADFALACWSGDSDELTLARDVWGRRPLYYKWEPGLLVFASDLKALAILEGASLAASVRATRTFLSHRSLGPTATLFDGVENVAPGRALTWTRAAKSAPRTTDLGRRNVAEGPATVKSALDAAVASRLNDASPTLLLSGGVDSTLLAERLTLVARDLDLLTWSDGGLSDETRLAAATAGRLGWRLRSIAIDGHSFLSAILSVGARTGHPPIDPSEPVIALLAQHSASRAILMGEGADELFGGYRYLHVQLAALERRHSARPICSDDYRDAFLSTRIGLNPRVVDRLLGEPETRDDTRAQAWELLTAGRYRMPLAALSGSAGSAWARLAAGLTDLYLTVHLPDLILRVDRATMCASREARLPFLADAITAIALRAPPDDFEALLVGAPARRCCGHDGAYLGKAALRSVVGDKPTGRRPKVGFRLPIGRWLREQEATVLAVIREGLSSAGCIDPFAAVAAARADLALRQHDADMRVFMLLALASTSV